MIWDEFLRHFRLCDEEDSGLSDKEQKRKGPKNRPKHTRERKHQDEKNFLEKFKTVSEPNEHICFYSMFTPKIIMFTPVYPKEFLEAVLNLSCADLG
ncbi:hypothetical protein [Phocaeicola salanitronis]|uniref:hypothetical protein n=1 Tax=Phocaeicola salanitronis TaxID=376805 RepID=UPI00320B3E6D